MIEIPFDKWSLRFTKQGIEEQYENFQNKERVNQLKILSFGLTLVALSCLILFIIQRQPAYLIFEMAFAFSGCFITLILSGKLIKFMKPAFNFFYVLCLATSVLINYSGIYVPHYVYGYCTALIYVSILQYCHNSAKVLFLVITPTLTLALFGVLAIDYLQYILLTITGIVLFSILTYKIEYKSRLLFAQDIIIKQQRELLHEYVGEPLFSMVLNERQNSLSLTFSNKKFEDFLHQNYNDSSDEDSEIMKEFLRNTFVCPKSEESLLIDFLKKKCKDNEKFSSLEHFLYERLTIDEGIIKNKMQENDIIMMRLSIDDIQEYKLSIKKINEGKPLLLVMILSNSQPRVQNQIQEQQKQFSELMVNISTQMAESQERFLIQIKGIENNNCNISSKIQNIQCCNISLITQLKNYILFFSQNRLTNLQQTIDQCILGKILESLNPYFQQRAIQSLRKFKLLNMMSQFQELKINSKILIQITINNFEQALKHSAQSDTIILKIQQKQNNNSQQPRYTQPDISKFKHEISESQEQNSIKVIQFSFTYRTIEKQNLQPIIDFRDYSIWSSIPSADLQINYTVSCLLLGMIGPYNHMITNQIQLENQVFCASLVYEVYTDQTQLDQSFSKYNKKH